MRKLAFLSLLVCGFTAQAQDQYLQVYQAGAVSSYMLADDDSLYLDATQTSLYFANDGALFTFTVANIDSITFLNDENKNVYVAFNGNSATVTNPLSALGVDVQVNGAQVTVTATGGMKNINYILSGTSSNGFFKVYSDNKYNVLLNNLALTNPVGPALNSQSDKNAILHLVSGTNSTITDGSTYNSAPIVNAVEEDQKAAIFGEGTIVFIGGGTLNVNGLGSDQHAIASDDDIEVLEGNVNVLSAVKDGIHGKDGYTMSGGNVNVQSTGDGVDGASGVVEISCGVVKVHNSSDDAKAITCDSTMTINGGYFELTMTGSQSIGFKSNQKLTINNGTIIASNSGNAVLVSSGSGYDPAYSSLITSDEDIEINGGNMTLTTTGKGARGIKGDQNVMINGGTISITSSGNGATYTNSTGTTTSYHSATIKVDGNLVVNDGTVTCSQSGTAGKGIMVDGTMTVGSSTSSPIISVTTTGSSLTVSSGSGGSGGGPGGGPGGGGSSSSSTTDKPKAVKADSDITFVSGTIAISSNDDGVKSLSSVTVQNADLTINNSTEGIEAPNITVNGGNVRINASDDGFNATQGATSGGTESNDGSLLKITGGYCYVSTTSGDGMDSNGNVQVTGGTVIVHGPPSSPELGLDYNGTGTISGGLALISGPSQNMLEGFGTSSTQRSFILKTTSSISANTIIHVEDNSGNELFTFKPERKYMTLVFSSNQITSGTTYKLYTSGSDSGTATDGYYTNGTYSPGNLKSTFTVSNMVTTVSF